MAVATDPTFIWWLRLITDTVRSECTCMAVATWPAPPQAEQVVALVPACTPLLLHFSHCSKRVTSMVFLRRHSRLGCVLQLTRDATRGHASACLPGCLQGLAA